MSSVKKKKKKRIAPVLTPSYKDRVEALEKRSEAKLSRFFPCRGHLAKHTTRRTPPTTPWPHDDVGVQDGAVERQDTGEIHS